jgi:hypothetical protein
MFGRFLTACSLAAIGSALLAGSAYAQCSTTFFSEDFEGTAGTLPVGWTTSGLWHMSQSCKTASSNDQCVDGWWMYYGVDAQCNYVSSSLKGELISPWIDFPALASSGGSIILDYCEAERTECEVEKFRLHVDELGGWTTSYNIRCDTGFMGGTPPYPLTHHAGKTVRLRWEFDAVDGIANDYRGILIDNLEITAYFGTGGDCNQNLTPDDCDIVLGTSTDCNADWQPDECQGLAWTICPANQNSVSPSGAKLSLSGSRIVPCNDLVLHISQVPANQVGIFIYSDLPTNIPFGEGVLCITGTVQRLLPPVFFDGAGTGSYALDYGNLPPGGQIQPGSTWYFQHWYRDPTFGLFGFNLSSAMRVDFAP